MTVVTSAVSVKRSLARQHSFSFRQASLASVRALLSDSRRPIDQSLQLHILAIMDYVERMSGRAGANLDPNALFKFTPLSPAVQQHLSRVYVTLTAALAVSAVGVLFSIVLSGFGGWLSMLGFMGCTVGLLSIQPTPHNLHQRYALLAGAAFSQGVSVGPLVNMAVHLHPSVVLTAFLGTTVVFGCFSVAALLAKRRSWLYIGGALSSAISLLAMMQLGSWFFGGRQMVFQAELYGGLIIFMGYILVDTQMIVEKAYAAHAAGTKPDHIRAALDLLVDFFAIFVRLLVILLKNAERREEDSRSRKRRS